MAAHDKIIWRLEGVALICQRTAVVTRKNARMGTIPTHIIEQVAAANDIVEVIGSYFPLKRAGATWKALCPFHQEKSPSFTVNPQRQIFKCFGCGEGGSIFKFVGLYEHVSFPEAVKKLAARAGIPVIEEQDRKSTRLN